MDLTPGLLSYLEWRCSNAHAGLKVASRTGAPKSLRARKQEWASLVDVLDTLVTAVKSGRISKLQATYRVWLEFYNEFARLYGLYRTRWDTPEVVALRERVTLWRDEQLNGLRTGANGLRTGANGLRRKNARVLTDRVRP